MVCDTVGVLCGGFAFCVVPAAAGYRQIADELSEGTRTNQIGNAYHART